MIGMNPSTESERRTATEGRRERKFSKRKYRDELGVRLVSELCPSSEPIESRVSTPFSLFQASQDHGSLAPDCPAPPWRVHSRKISRSLPSSEPGPVPPFLQPILQPLPVLHPKLGPESIPLRHSAPSRILRLGPTTARTPTEALELQGSDRHAGEGGS